MMEKTSTNPAPAARIWTAPRLVKLGTIADVAGSGTANQQGSSGNKT